MPRTESREAVVAGSRERKLMVEYWNLTQSREAVTATKRGRTMGSFPKLTYHVVFSTKYRRKSITDDLRERLYEYMGGIVRNLNGSLIEIGGIEDHVHLLANLSPAKSVSDSIRDIKSNASKWVNELPGSRNPFSWQKGYGAFTVSHSQIEIVCCYIQNQREHHLTRTFEEELIELLRRHEIEFDHKYLFEAEHIG